MAVCLPVYMLRAVMAASALHHWLFWAVVQFTDLSSLATSEEVRVWNIVEAQGILAFLCL